MLRRYPVVNVGLGEASRIEDSIAIFGRTISSLEELAKQLPEGSRVVALRKAVECREFAEEMRGIPEATLPEAEPVVNKCIQELKQVIDKEISGQVASPAKESTGIPTLAYVGAGVVAIGITAFLALYR